MKRRVEGMKEIEALESFRIKDGKWMIEIKVPWERLSPELKPLENIPFCIAVFDGDDKAKLKNETIASNCELSAKNEPTGLGSLVVEEQQKIMESFLQSTKLSREDITKEFYLDVAGDSQLDRVVFAGSVFGVFGVDVDVLLLFEVTLVLGLGDDEVEGFAALLPFVFACEGALGLGVGYLLSEDGGEQAALDTKHADELLAVDVFGVVLDGAQHDVGFAIAVNVH